MWWMEHPQPSEECKRETTALQQRGFRCYEENTNRKSACLEAEVAVLAPKLDAVG